MDTITQITLGAAVGEACLGREIGNKAAGWGAVLGVVPDLDVFANPFVTEVQELAIHRGITHSLFFSVVAAPLLGWLLYRYYRGDNVSWRRWSLLVFLVLFTHVFIDACTSYGTQVLQPFSNYTFSFNTIFIIDPFYSLPLMAGVLISLFMRRHTPARRWANYLGLGFSSLYLAAGFAIKGHVNGVFEENFNTKDIPAERYMTTPMPFTEFLWVGYARSDEAIYAGLYSIFDDDREIEFRQVDINDQLIAPYRGQLPVERIRWFSQGYYSVTEEGGGLYMHDIRFGRWDLWLREEPSPLIWSYRLEFNDDSTRVVGFDHLDPGVDLNRKRIAALWGRILGE